MLSEFRSRVNGQDSKCQAFDELLDAVFHRVAILYSEKERAEFIAYLWELFGYLICPQKDVPVFMFWIGREDSGMLQVLRVLKHFVGCDAVFEGKAKTLLGVGVSKSKSAKKLEGKLLFVDNNVERGTRVCDGLLKTFSESKRLSIFSERGGNRFAWTTATPLLCMDADHLRFSDDSYAFERRTHAIYFDSAVDVAYAESMTQKTIRDEMQGVFNNALRGLISVKERRALALPASAVDFRKLFLDTAVTPKPQMPGANRWREAKP